MSLCFFHILLYVDIVEHSLNKKLFGIRDWLRSLFLTFDMEYRLDHFFSFSQLQVWECFPLCTECMFFKYCTRFGQNIYTSVLDQWLSDFSAR